MDLAGLLLLARRGCLSSHLAHCVSELCKVLEKVLRDHVRCKPARLEQVAVVVLLRVGRKQLH